MYNQRFLDAIYSILTLGVVVDISQGQTQCVMNDLCSCTLSDGTGVVDISSLGNNGGPAMFADITGPDNYVYSLNLCYPFDEVACTSTAACQMEPDMSSSYNLGDSSSATFEVDSLNEVHVKYTADTGDGNIRTTDVTLVCDPNTDPASVLVNGEQGPGSLIYAFTLTTKCACGNGCSAGPPPEPTTTPKPPPGPPGPHPPGHESGSGGGISIGTVICIVVLSVGFVYLVGGMLFMRLQRQAQGKEMVPNVGFWSSIPGLIRDGFAFVYRKIRNKGGYGKV